MRFCDHCDRPIFAGVHAVRDVVTADEDNVVVHEQCAVDYQKAGGRIRFVLPAAPETFVTEVEGRFLVAEPVDEGFAAVVHGRAGFKAVVGSVQTLMAEGAHHFSRRRDAARKASQLYDFRCA